MLAHDLGLDVSRKWDLNARDLNVRDPNALASIALEEKSWTHRLIDQNEFLQKYLAKVRLTLITLTRYNHPCYVYLPTAVYSLTRS